jgi:hypothetical protein
MNKLTPPGYHIRQQIKKFAGNLQAEKHKLVYMEFLCNHLPTLPMISVTARDSTVRETLSV